MRTFLKATAAMAFTAIAINSAIAGILVPQKNGGNAKASADQSAKMDPGTGGDAKSSGDPGPGGDAKKSGDPQGGGEKTINKNGESPKKQDKQGGSDAKPRGIIAI